MKTKNFLMSKAGRDLLLLAILTIGVTNVWATEYATVATFSSSTVVTASSYATYQNDDWYLSKGGNNNSGGFNANNMATIGNAFGTSANTAHHGFYIKTKSALSNVCRITFVYTGGSGNSGGKIYLGYSTDNGDTWSAVTLKSGSGLTGQGDGVGSTSTTYTMEFDEISSALYCIIISANQTFSTNTAFRFDYITATFQKEKVMRTVQWKVQGENYTTGDPSSSVAVGDKVAKLPTAPAGAPTNCGVFLGWSATAIDGSTNTEPSDLFSTAGDAPEAPAGSGAIVYHAVFADIKAVAP